MIPFLSRLNNEAAHCFNDTFLRITAYNSVANASVTYRWESYVKDGTKNPGSDILSETVTEGEQSFSPTSDRLASVSIVPLREGMLYSLRVSGTGGILPLQRGQCFIKAELQKGPGAGGYVFRTLFADYLLSNTNLTFPGNTITSPTDGNGYFTQYGVGMGNVLTAPANIRWRLVEVRMAITTDATAGNRLSAPYATVGGAVHRFPLSPAIPPSQANWDIIYAFYGNPPAQFVELGAANTQIAFDCISELFLVAADTVSFNNNQNFTGADLAASAGRIYVEEWISL